jgi:hypothetical protein
LVWFFFINKKIKKNEKVNKSRKCILDESFSDSKVDVPLYADGQYVKKITLSRMVEKLIRLILINSLFAPSVRGGIHLTNVYSFQDILADI